MKNLTLSLLLTTAPLFAGVEAPIMAPPAPDCDSGFSLGLEALYLRPYHSEGAYNEGDFEFGGRGSLGYEFNDCLFVKATYFGYNADVYHDEGDDGPSFTYENEADVEVSYLDLVVGQHFKPSEKLTLSPYVGLRWATFDESGKSTQTSGFQGINLPGQTITTYKDSAEFSGLGVVVGIDGTRSFGGGFSLYGTAKQSVVFGTTDFSSRVDREGGISPVVLVNSDDYSDDRVIFISELGLGVQYAFSFANVAANIRAGVEGQWWAGASGGSDSKAATLKSGKVISSSSSGSGNAGFGGFVVGANFVF